VADVGGAPSGTSPYDISKFAAILRGEVAMGLHAHNIGGSEAALGAETLRRMAKETKAPFISANVLDAKGDRVAPADIQVTIGGRRLLLIGVLSAKFASGDLQVSDPAEAVLRVLDGRQGSFDAVAVLAYLPLDELEVLARALPEVDLVIGGPTTQSVAPHRVGAALVGAATNKGKFLLRFEAPLSDAHHGWSGEIVEVDSSLPDDPEQVENLRRYHGELAVRDFSASETSFAPVPPDPVPDGYQVLGTQACQKCHEQDCRSWRESPHATAWQTLTSGSAHVDSYCQQCHTTGFGLPGGFVSAKSSADRVSVGCESCHGPGLAHARDPRHATLFAAADQCARCHDRENSPVFDYDVYWPKIQHGDQPPRTSAGKSDKSRLEIGP